MSGRRSRFEIWAPGHDYGVYRFFGEDYSGCQVFFRGRLWSSGGFSSDKVYGSTLVFPSRRVRRLPSVGCFGGHSYFLRRHTEVGQDFKIVLLETGSELGKEREAWRVFAMNFLSLEKKAGEARLKSFRKKERLASRDVLLRTDEQLAATLDTGLASRCRELPKDENCEQVGPKEVLPVHSDRGPDGACAIYDLLNKLKAETGQGCISWAFRWRGLSGDARNASAGSPGKSVELALGESPAAVCQRGCGRGLRGSLSEG